ncbi:MAG TPA: phosphoribosylaminoimidazolesuccinocarboxamide synthase, partial [Candidatus Obscuribacter sp.]|nr:phosphoribosylaminoimidazolesuccinocarboxamide synthase [Candidatus Obscuribacter sp.]
RHYLQTIFSALEPSETLANHYRGLYSRGKTFKLSAPALADQDQSQELYLQVARARVDRPEVRKIGQSLVYFYDAAARGEGLSFIPLEVVFRFAAPAGSSLLSRLEKDPNYAYVLGLEPDAVKVGALFPHPVIEFFTKLEPSDRLLSYQEAAAIAGLSPAEFERLYQTAHLCALAIFHVFAEQGITLLDGKVEAAVERRLSGKGEMTSRIVLADSIGPDELRLDYKGIQLSKEVLRRYYRNTAWYREIESSKAEAAKRPSVKWQDICRHEKGSAPPPLPPALKECIANMYLALAATMVGGPLAEKICPLSLPAVAEQLAKEIDLAEKEGKP